MESYDIIANQPVVIDNVRPGSRGEGGRPAAGVVRGRTGRDPTRLGSSSEGCLPGSRASAWPCGPGLGARAPAPGAVEPLPKPSPAGR